MSGRGRGGRGGGGVFGNGAADAGDEASNHLAAMSRASAAAFAAAHRSESYDCGRSVPDSAAVPGVPTRPVSAAPSASRASFLKRMLPGLAPPPMLAAAVLPEAAFVNRVVDHFDYTREAVTAARGCVLKAGSLPAHRRERAARTLPRCPAQLPRATTPAGQLAPWYEFVATTAVPYAAGRVAIGPALGAFAFSDYAAAAALLTVAARSVLRRDVKWVPPPARSNAPLDPNADSSTAASDGGDIASDDGDGANQAGDAPLKRTRSEPGALDAAADLRSVCAAQSPQRPVVELERATELDGPIAEALEFVVFTHYCGGGAWLWGALAAVHDPLDPDSDRLLHSVFTALVRHLDALHKAFPQAFASLAFAPEDLAPPTFEAGERVRLRCDGQTALQPAALRSCLALLVVLGKVFKQANPALLPL